MKRFMAGIAPLELVASESPQHHGLAFYHLGTDVHGVHIAQCERSLYFVNVLKKSKTTKKGPPFGEPFQTAQQSGFCLVGAIGLEPTTPTMSRWCSNQLSYVPAVRRHSTEFRRGVNTFFRANPMNMQNI